MSPFFMTNESIWTITNKTVWCKYFIYRSLKYWLHMDILVCLLIPLSKGNVTYFMNLIVTIAIRLNTIMQWHYEHYIPPSSISHVYIVLFLKRIPLTMDEYLRTGVICNIRQLNGLTFHKPHLNPHKKLPILLFIVSPSPSNTLKRIHIWIQTEKKIAHETTRWHGQYKEVFAQKHLHPFQ